MKNNREPALPVLKFKVNQSLRIGHLQSLNTIPKFRLAPLKRCLTTDYNYGTRTNTFKF